MERDPLAAHNGRMKLLAGFIDALGIGPIGFAVLGPLTGALSNAAPSTARWGGAGLALHGLSHDVLGRMRRGVKP